MSGLVGDVVVSLLSFVHTKSRRQVVFFLKAESFAWYGCAASFTDSGAALVASTALRIQLGTRTWYFLALVAAQTTHTLYGNFLRTSMDVFWIR